MNAPFPKTNTAELPSLLAQELRQIKLDKFTGSVELNILEGQIMGYHYKKVVKFMRPA